MKRFLLSITFALKLSVLLFSGFVQAGKPVHDHDLGALQCNWGILTMNAILYLENYEQGQHASGEDTPRVGLPNVPGEEDPNLEATCQIVGCLAGIIPEEECL